MKPVAAPVKKNGERFDDWMFQFYKMFNQASGIVSVTTATYSVTGQEKYIICNFAGVVTLTFPAQLSPMNPINVKTITANAVNSASANMVPNAGGAAGTAIVTGTAGNWADIVFNGTNYTIVKAK